MANSNRSEHEDEIIDNEVPPEFIEGTPLDEPVIERSYTKANVNITAEEGTRPIPEPDFKVPPSAMMGGENNVGEEEKKTGAAAKPAPTASANPAFANAPEVDKKKGTKHLAGLLLTGYRKLHDVANLNLQISERKLERLQMEGEINLRMSIPYNLTDSIMAGEWIREFNGQMSQLLSVDPEWEAKVRPLLEEALAKKGWGLSNEQSLAFLIAEDVGTKLFMFRQMKRQSSDMIEILRDLNRTIRETGHNSADQRPFTNDVHTPPPPPPAGEAAPTPPPAAAPTVFAAPPPSPAPPPQSMYTPEAAGSFQGTTYAVTPPSQSFVPMHEDTGVAAAPAAQPASPASSEPAKEEPEPAAATPIISEADTPASPASAPAPENDPSTEKDTAPKSNRPKTYKKRSKKKKGPVEKKASKSRKLKAAPPEETDFSSFKDENKGDAPPAPEQNITPDSVTEDVDVVPPAVAPFAIDDEQKETGETIILSGLPSLEQTSTPIESVDL